VRLGSWSWQILEVVLVEHGNLDESRSSGKQYDPNGIVLWFETTMTLDQLRYFLAAARFEHIGKAARSVAISPSAVSTAIAVLEDELGCLLFRREGKAIILNDQGKYLRAELEIVFDHLAAIRNALQGAAAAIQGSYRLGASHSLATRVLARAWIALQREHPKLQGELCSMATSNALREVMHGTLDLALVYSPLRNPELRQFELYAGQMVIVVRRRHPVLRAPHRAQLQRLSEFPAALHKAATGVEICEVHPMFEKFGIDPQISCLWESDDQALETVIHSDTWAMVPDYMARSTASPICTLPIPRGWVAPYTIAAVMRPHRADNQTLLLLIARMRDALGAKR
jgi:DNA-binding transcriptional LysR family regulator